MNAIYHDDFSSFPDRMISFFVMKYNIRSYRHSFDRLMFVKCRAFSICERDVLKKLLQKITVEQNIIWREKLN